MVVNRVAALSQPTRRFGVNQYETFLLACKIDEHDNPILPGRNWQNVFNFRLPDSDTRRHVMHKPERLLQEIIEIISHEDSLGCDPSAGSGSIIEAAIKTGRNIRTCEIDEDYAETCIQVARETLADMAQGKV